MDDFGEAGLFESLRPVGRGRHAVVLIRGHMAAAHAMPQGKHEAGRGWAAHEGRGYQVVPLVLPLDVKNLCNPMKFIRKQLYFLLKNLKIFKFHPKNLLKK